MATRTSTEWIGGMAFDTAVNGHHVIMDVGPEQGGADKGPKPKPLVLAALSGCSAMDIVSLLEKMRVEGYKFRIDAEADSTTDHPVIYHTIRLDFRFWGENLPPDKILKAVGLSTQRYCGVHEMLRRSSNIIVRTYINDEEVNQ